MPADPHPGRARLAHLRREYDRLSKHHESLNYEHDGWLYCPCRAAEAVRVVFAALYPPQPKPHRLAVLD
jgi:hypothetical protein